MRKFIISTLSAIAMALPLGIGGLTLTAPVTATDADANLIQRARHHFNTCSRHLVTKCEGSIRGRVLNPSSYINQLYGSRWLPERSNGLDEAAFWRLFHHQRYWTYNHGSHHTEAMKAESVLQELFGGQIITDIYNWNLNQRSEDRFRVRDYTNLGDEPGYGTCSYAGCGRLSGYIDPVEAERFFAHRARVDNRIAAEMRAEEERIRREEEIRNLDAQARLDRFRSECETDRNGQVGSFFFSRAEDNHACRAFNHGTRSYDLHLFDPDSFTLGYPAGFTALVQQDVVLAEQRRRNRLEVFRSECGKREGRFGYNARLRNDVCIYSVYSDDGFILQGVNEIEFDLDHPNLGYLDAIDPRGLDEITEINERLLARYFDNCRNYGGFVSTRETPEGEVEYTCTGGRGTDDRFTGYDPDNPGVFTTALQISPVEPLDSLAEIEDIADHRQATSVNRETIVTIVEEFNELEERVLAHNDRIAENSFLIEAVADRLVDIDDRAKKNTAGIALGYALATPGLLADKRFAFGGGIGSFEGENAVAFTLTGRITDSIVANVGGGMAGSGNTGVNGFKGTISFQW